MVNSGTLGAEVDSGVVVVGAEAASGVVVVCAEAASGVESGVGQVASYPIPKNPAMPLHVLCGPSVAQSVSSRSRKTLHSLYSVSLMVDTVSVGKIKETMIFVMIGMQMKIWIVAVCGFAAQSCTYSVFYTGGMCNTNSLNTEWTQSDTESECNLEPSCTGYSYAELDWLQVVLQLTIGHRHGACRLRHVRKDVPSASTPQLPSLFATTNASTVATTVLHIQPLFIQSSSGNYCMKLNGTEYIHLLCTVVCILLWRRFWV